MGGKKNNRKGIIWGILGVVLVAAAVVLLIFLLPRQVSFDIGYDAEAGNPGRQMIRRGQNAAEPAIEAREGYAFIGWYEKDARQPYDFSQPVNRNVSLTARWYDETDTRDTDGDDLPDSVELQLGTDINNPDSDSDGIPDGTEVRMLNTDPLSGKTNDVADGEDDPDWDGLTNSEEAAAGTNPAFYDTDWDGLSDREELRIYHTDPLREDTDGDGVQDGKEILLDCNPLVSEETFMTAATFGELTEDDPVALDVIAVTDSAGAGTLSARKLDAADGMAFSECAVGLLGSAYDITAEGYLDNAQITFRLDPSLGTPGVDYEPRIYWYDEENHKYVELEDQILTEDSVSAGLTHFSIYAVLNKTIVDFFISLLPDSYQPDLTDANNDLLPDVYARMLNDGRLLYDESGWLVGVLDALGEDDDDWDNDGLKNGEEIEIEPVWTGGLRVVIHSDPRKLDSDRDGIGDYAEVKQLHTQPMTYDRPSVGALDQLKNDSKYDYSGRKRDGYDSIALFLYFRKYDKAKECMIDYFYNYASDETVRKNADKIAAQAVYDDAVRIAGAVSDLITTAKGIYSVVDTGTQLADLDDMYYETLQMREYLLSAMNAEAIGEMRAEELIAIGNTLAMPDKLMNTEQKLMSDDAFSRFSGGAAVVGLAEKAIKSYKKVRDKEIFDLARSFDKCEKGAQALGKSSGMTFNTKMSIAKDTIEGVEAMMKTYAMYGKISANMDAFNMYTELLLDVRDHAGDGFVKDAAADLARDILSECGLDYFLDMSAAIGRDMAFAAFEVALDVLAEVHPVFKIIDAFFDLYEYTGMISLSESNVYFAVMADISASCERLLDARITKRSQTFSYNKDLYEAEVEKYLVQLAQSRIIGEYRFGEYCGNNSMVGIIASILDGKSPDEYRQMQKRDILEVYRNANRLELKLSSKLPYFGETSHVPSPDKITGIADLVSLPDSLNTFLSYFYIYHDAENGNEFSRDQIDGLCSTILDSMIFHPYCVQYSIYPGEGPQFDVGTHWDPRGWSNDKPDCMIDIYDEIQIKWILKHVFGVTDEQYRSMLAAAEAEGAYYAEDDKIYYFTYGIGYDGVLTTVLKAEIVDDEFRILYSEVHPDGYFGWADTPHAYYDGIFYARMRFEEIDGERYWTLLSNTEHIPEGLWGGNWKDDYYDFIMRGDYWETGIYSVNKSYNEYSPIRFGLHDMDADGIPELIGFSGGDSYAAETYYAYTWKDGEIIPLGPLYGHGLYHFRNPEYPGILEYDAHTGGYYAVYMRLDDGGLTEEFVWSATDEGGTLTELSRTEDYMLYGLFMDKRYEPIRMTSARDLLIDKSLWDMMVIDELDYVAAME